MKRLLDKLLAGSLLLTALISCGRAMDSQVTTPADLAEDPGQTAAEPAPAKIAGQEGMFELGDVRFSSHHISLDSSESVAVAAADLDGDGHLDLVTSGDPQLNLLYGDGTGEFASPVRVPGGDQPMDFALADLDQDGDIDIVIANHDTQYLTILLGDAGEFRLAPYAPLQIAVAPHPHAVRAADLDLDGIIDLVVDHRDGNGLLILRGLSGGGFESPGTLIEVGGDPYLGMAVGDIDGDGKIDLVTPNPGEVGVMLNASGGRIEFEPGVPVAAQSPFAVGLGDFNGDGNLDLLAASDEGSPLVQLFLGNGLGRFEEAGDSPIRFAPGGKNIAVGDFNGDGLADAAVACWQSPDALILLGGRETFQTALLPGGEHPWGLAAADLNADGKDDLVIADDTRPQAVIYLSVDP